MYGFGSCPRQVGQYAGMEGSPISALHGVSRPAASCAALPVPKPKHKRIQDTCVPEQVANVVLSRWRRTAPDEPWQRWDDNMECWVRRVFCSRAKRFFSVGRSRQIFAEREEWTYWGL